MQNTANRLWPSVVRGDWTRERDGLFYNALEQTEARLQQ